MFKNVLTSIFILTIICQVANAKTTRMNIEVNKGTTKRLILRFVPDPVIKIGYGNFVEITATMGTKEIIVKGLNVGKADVLLKNLTNPKDKIVLKIKVTPRKRGKTK